jgi:hypothetical protein
MARCNRMRQCVAAVIGVAMATCLGVTTSAAATGDAPSRPASKNCKWQKIADATVGLAAWVQRCDYGFRKIDFLFQQNSLAIRYSDGGAPDPLIDVFDLLPGETPEAGVKRIVAANAEKSLAQRYEQNLRLVAP